VQKYRGQIREIFRGLFPVLRTRGHAVVNVPDMWWKNDTGGERIPLHMHVYDALVEAGYEFRNTIIWDRTNIVNRVGIFGWPSNYITMGTTFEYLLDFWKPS
jgi:DNA modification methylase